MIILKIHYRTMNFIIFNNLNKKLFEKIDKSKTLKITVINFLVI